MSFVSGCPFIVSFYEMNDNHAANKYNNHNCVEDNFGDHGLWMQSAISDWIVARCGPQSKSIFMENIAFIAWSSLPCTCPRIKPFRWFCFGGGVCADLDAFVTLFIALSIWFQLVDVLRQVCFGNVRVRANEALDAVTECHLMHVRCFHSSAIVIKCDLLHVLFCIHNDIVLCLTW